MEIVRSVTMAGPASSVFELVDDLSSYPEWMALVHDVEPVDAAVGEQVGGDSAVWEVELQAQVGPFARSKRLRMQRTEHVPSSRVRFERVEIDGREHAPWVLAAVLAPVLAESTGDPQLVELTMTLTYGGNLWTGAVLQRVLDDHVEQGAQALKALVEQRG